MSIITDTTDTSGRYINDSAKVVTADVKKDVKSNYVPTELERKAINSILALTTIHH
jgi:hypothetical protein